VPSFFFTLIIAVPVPYAAGTGRRPDDLGATEMIQLLVSESAFHHQRTGIPDSIHAFGTVLDQLNSGRILPSAS